MAPTKLLKLREEFYTTPITLEEICLREDITLEDLPGSDKWQKPLELQTANTEPSTDLTDGTDEDLELKEGLRKQAKNILKRVNKMLVSVDNAKDLKELATVHKEVYLAHFGKVTDTPSDDAEGTWEQLMKKYSDD
jgi:hypothetical protein